ncbi:DEAD/DEAH box helicase [Limosilactobacillus fermentum]|jgi:superfamily II DNA/RNA helicase|uniref:ATP-dependent RNA helicase n=7 Tax=Limosilactobacillus fermentum TaxID=1613 RepID=A0A1D7ZVL4_LIMFE|nr:ATP-dependent RNA helicase [Limosilactobacillus fermentum]EEX25917.1 DEAD/DEAH box helicase [Limosilactobacillus fermentum 28-3-CHN]ESS01692.1 helicase [Limosilactobacillus fermentum NB-22]CDI69677.1 ATP-dependent RNA helicase [Limosilactobacillus fermentum L930BB]BAG27770.1 ATP-dependent RNA helicase [Limosilactobacillus fermentum IFO 3956]
MIDLIEQFQTHFEERNFKQLTAIQEAVQKPLEEDKTVFGIAPTGSGKTLAFTWPLLPKVMKGQGTQILVLEPSQELALQTTRVMREWAALLGLKVHSATGGANLRRQTERLKKERPEVVVGTPGRILHLLDTRDLKLNNLATLVIDEADDLLRDDTQAVVEDIERATPLDTQLAFFSATQSTTLEQLDVLFGRDLVKIDVRAQDHSRGPVKHGLVVARTMSDKAVMLERLSQTKNFRALVFFTSIKTLHYTASRLRHDGISSATLGGRQRQTERETVMRQFRKHQVKLLLTTDVAARGLDIPKLPAVVNFELPNTADGYVHRTGRTGRQGEPGLVVNLGDDHDFRDLKKLLADTDYQLEPMTIDKRQLVSGEDAKNAGKSVEKATVKAVQKRQHDAKGNPKKEVVRTLDSFSQPAKAKHKKKNRKNKGIRLKHRRKNEEQQK